MQTMRHSTSQARRNGRDNDDASPVLLGDSNPNKLNIFKAKLLEKFHEQL